MSPSIQAHCEAVRTDAGGVTVFTFRVPGESPDFTRSLRRGRHVVIDYPDISGIVQERPYSITDVAGNGSFEIAVRNTRRGGVSESMHSTLRAGSTVSLRSVAGAISVDSVLCFERLGMIAGGIGVTLPVALLRELADHARQGKRVPDTALILSFPRFADIPFLHELLELSVTMPWLDLKIHITQESFKAFGHFVSGRPSVDSLTVLGQPQSVVICGSHGFAHAFREHTLACFPDASQQIESFTPPNASSRTDDDRSAEIFQLQIAQHDRVIEARSGKSLLEILEGADVPIRNHCRSGICGNCRIRIAGGVTRFEPDFCLSDSDRHNGYALACCTFPISGRISIDMRFGA